MQTLFNIIVTFVLLLWPLLMIASIMIYDAPGAANDLSKMLQQAVIVYYPVPIFLIYCGIFGIKFWGISENKCIWGSVIICLLVSIRLGPLPYIFNYCRGLNNDGYTIKDTSLYYDASFLSQNNTAPKIIIDDRQQSIAVDDLNVYSDGKLVEGADPKDFKRLENSNYSISAGKVFWFSEVIPGASAAEWIILDDGYGRDNQHLYRGKHILSFNGDVKSLEFFGGFARDSKNVYLHKIDNRAGIEEFSVIEGADPKTAVLIDYRAFKDKAHTYRVEDSQIHRE